MSENNEAFVTVVNAVNAPEPLLTTMEIYHPQMTERIYIVDDVVDHVINGRTYLACPFEYTPPNSEDQVLSVGSISIINLGNQLIDDGNGNKKTLSEWLDQIDYGRGVRCTVEQLVASDPTPQLSFGFEFSDISIDREKVTAQLKFGTNSMNNHAVAMFFTPFTCPGIF